MNRSDIDALAEQWVNGNREHVIFALSILDGPFAALAGAYLYHEMPDDWHRGVFARMLQSACEKRQEVNARGTCRACVNGFPLEMTACPSCGRTREPNKPRRARKGRK